MKSKKVLAILLTAIVASSSMIGCGKKDPKPAETGKADTNDTKKDDTKKEDTKKEEMDKDQSITMLIGAEPKTLDQSVATDMYSSQVLENIMEGLTRLEVDAQGNDVVKEAGAEKIEVSPDGLVWTFKIRDHKWSDGKPVTADQYEYSLKRTLAPETASEYAAFLYCIKGGFEYNKKKASAADVGIKAVDEKTLQITLKSPNAYFKKLLSFKIFQPQRKDIVEANGSKYGTEVDKIVCNGPFILKEWVHNNKFVFEKNPNYWDAKNVKLQKVTFRVIKDIETRMNELDAGGLDLAGVDEPQWIQKFDASKKFDVDKGFRPSTSYALFNEKNKLLSNANIRKAFSASINREESVKVLSRGIGEPAYAWSPPSLLIGTEDFRKKCGEDPVKKLIQENKNPKDLIVKGLKELNLDADPAKHSIELLSSNASSRSKESAEFHQRMWKQALGLDVKIKYVEWSAFGGEVHKGNYEIATMGWTGDYNDPMTMFDMWLSDAPIVPLNWKNDKYDELVRKAGELPDTKNDERFKLFKEAEKILLYDDAAIAPMFYQKRNTYIYKYVKNYTVPMFSAGADLKHVYISGKGK